MSGNHPAAAGEDKTLASSDLANYRVIGMDLPQSFHTPFKSVAEEFERLGIEESAEQQAYVVGQDPISFLAWCL